MTSTHRAMAPLAFLVLFGALAGCAGDPDIDGDGAALVFDVSVAGDAWREAPLGCEDVPVEGLSLAACEGEPGLAALLDRHGRVECVDALRVLVPLSARTGITPRAGDPSPQPNRPPPPGSSAALDGQSAP